MKVIKKNVYYCGFCKKRGLSAGAMKHHENHCTANPKRECSVCGYGGNLAGVMDKYRAMFTVEERSVHYENEFEPPIVATYLTPFTWQDVAQDFDQCPACTLAALRQLGLTRYWHGEIHRTYDRKKHFAEWWATKNDEERARAEDYDAY